MQVSEYSTLEEKLRKTLNDLEKRDRQLAANETEVSGHFIVKTEVSGRFIVETEVNGRFIVKTEVSGRFIVKKDSCMTYTCVIRGYHFILFISVKF